MPRWIEASLAGAAECSQAERLGWDRDVLGFFLSGHPLDGYADQLRRFADCSVAELPQRLEAGAERATVAGLVSGLKVIPIKREGPNHGRRMGVCELEDPTGSVRVGAFPDAFDRAERALADGSAVLVVAALKGEGDHVELSAEEVSALDGLAARRASALRVVVNLDEADEASLEELREFLLDHPGDLAVRFELLRRGRFRARLVPPPALAVDASQETLDALHERLGSGWYEFEYDTPLAGDGSATPAVEALDVAYLQRNLRPRVEEITVHPPGVVFQKPINVTTEAEILGLEHEVEPVPAAVQGPRPASSAGLAFGRKLFRRGLRTFSWRASDPNADALAYDIAYRAVGETRFRTVRRGFEDDVIAWDTTTLPNGRYVLRVTASDAPANPDPLALTAWRESTPFEVDNTPPLLELSWVAGAARVRGTARDADSLLAQLEYSVDGGRFEEVHPADGLCDAGEESFEFALPPREIFQCSKHRPSG